MTGMSYAAVPLYRAFCGATGFAGIPMTEKSRMDPTKLVPTSSERRITVHFNAATSDVLPWKFKPAQTTVTVRPGETALAFYTAENYGKDDIVGISTYNVRPCLSKLPPFSVNPTDASQDLPPRRSSPARSRPTSPRSSASALRSSESSLARSSTCPSSSSSIGTFSSASHPLFPLLL